MTKMNSSLSRKVFLVINYFIITLMALICILPFLNLLAISFSAKEAVIANEVTFWPIGFSLR
ncbi:MAG: transporter permease [Eubacterium sp.]|nr:transporter permease [Eubacterium sp.]